ncbi:hypothetical protein M426DRAFT_324180 [Hypoxylon sp. CI-4A]|nr:hypothetical protein M426DRAFT_324180 [Hypoxylon sp. CI-4A]
MSEDYDSEPSGPDVYGGESSDSSEESESTSNYRNTFFDIEAQESDDSDEDEDEDENEYEDEREKYYFPQFMRLPPELREQVWAAFDPGLKSKARLFCLKGRQDSLEFWEGPYLSEQVAPTMAMMGTHQESRQLALKAYPNTFELYAGRTVLRYNRERDVLFIAGRSISARQLGMLAMQPQNPQNLAFDSLFSRAWEELKPEIAERIKSLYLCCECWDFQARKTQWCVSDSINYAYFEEEPVYDDYPYTEGALETMYCWPDLNKHEEFAKENVTPIGTMSGIVVWPLVEFPSKRGLDRHRALQVAVATEGEWKDKWDSDDESNDGSDEESVTADEYESEGIDDATIDGEESESESEDDLVVHDSESEEDDVEPSSFTMPDGEEAEVLVGGDVSAGNFSDLEPESPIRDGSEVEHESSDEEPVQPAARRKRRIVSSDDEDDAEDDGEEKVGIPFRSMKRARIVLSDSEDEDEEDGVNEGGAHLRRGSSDKDSEESSDDSEDEEPAKEKPMSIFEKLSQFRQDNPVSPNSYSDSDSERSMHNDDFESYGGVNYVDDEVDDEDGSLQGGGEELGMEEYSEDEDDDDDGW